MTDHETPFQDSTRVEPPTHPTATQLVGPIQDTASGPLPPTLGLGVIDQTLPFQDSSIDPTTSQLAQVVHEMPARAPALTGLATTAHTFPFQDSMSV